VPVNRTQRLWKYYFRFKKGVRLIYELSSFALILMTFEKAVKLKTMSAVKPWQIFKVAEKLPRLLQTLGKTFAAGWV